MPTITKITRQKRASDRYNIFLDESYAFSVTEDTFIKFNLHKGLTLSEGQINDIQANDSKQRAYTQAIHYLSYRMRTKEEIRTHLRTKDVPSFVIEEIIERLKNEMYVNDSGFSNAFVRDRINHSTKGPVLIEKELIEKGVAVQIAKEAIKQYSYEEQFDTAFKWAQKELRRRSNHSYNRQMDQLKMKLLRKGFQGDVLNDVIQEVKPPIDEEAEVLALKTQADKLHRRLSRRHEGYELQMRLRAGLFQRGFRSHLINEYVAELDERL